VTSGYDASIEMVDPARRTVFQPVTLPYGSFNLASAGHWLVATSVLNGEVTVLRAATLRRAQTTVASVARSGMAPISLEAIVEAMPDGVVLEGFGGGHIPPNLLEVLDEATRHDIPTVIASRCGDGPTLHFTYPVPGAEIDLQARGAVMAGSLSAVKARLRLAVALATDTPLSVAFPAE
jgi:L-asparaginase/Glu-tRNA(Gln) amidotransferase subunit D